MGEFLARLTTYNLFNYLFPGAIFVIALRALGIPLLETGSVVYDLFVFYFAGLVVSRVGSLIIEPAFKKIKVVEYAEYADYLKAADADKKIPELLEINNVYRTLVSLFFCIGLVLVGEHLAPLIGLTEESAGIVGVVAVLILFIGAYRKQTTFIRKRVEHNLRKET